MAVAQEENVDLATKVGRLEGTVEQILQRLTALEGRLTALEERLERGVSALRAENRWIGLVLAALIGALGFWR